MIKIGSSSFCELAPVGYMMNFVEQCFDLVGIIARTLVTTFELLLYQVVTLSATGDDWNIFGR